MKHGHGKKMIAPVIITIIIVLYYLGIGVFFLLTPTVRVVTALIVLVSVLLSGVMISVLISRIKEIRSGEEDDLGKY